MSPSPGRAEVIDSDGHVVEPDAVWHDYADPAFRERLDVPGGGVQALGISRAYPSIAAPTASTDGESWADNIGNENWDDESRLKMGRPGGYDPKARLLDMDSEGIDRAVLYPTSMLTWVEEADLFGAACSAYN